MEKYRPCDILNTGARAAGDEYLKFKFIFFASLACAVFGTIRTTDNITKPMRGKRIASASFIQIFQTCKFAVAFRSIPDAVENAASDTSVQAELWRLQVEFWRLNMTEKRW